MAKKLVQLKDKDNNELYPNIDNSQYEKVLWKNPSPTVNFSNQKITLNESLNNFNSMEIIYMLGAGNVHDNYLFSTGRIPVGNTVLGINGMYRFERRITIFDGGNSITFKDAEIYDIYNNSASTINNSRVIPFYVIGYKTSLFN